MKKTQLNKIIKDMELPEGTIFLGYSIHLKDSDEFLLNYEDTNYSTNMYWIKTPENAKHFQSLKKAEKTRNNIKPEASIVWLFDTGPQIIATQPADYN